uniref:Uncharacterized protein n=1 Tax=Anguilla anguilla TaxID=7936 RepID=A0A0E9PDM8_ANGAN
MCVCVYVDGLCLDVGALGSHKGPSVERKCQSLEILIWPERRF